MGGANSIQLREWLDLERVFFPLMFIEFDILAIGN